MRRARTRRTSKKNDAVFSFVMVVLLDPKWLGGRGRGGWRAGGWRCRFLAKSNGRLHGSSDTGVFLQPHRQREHGLTSNQIRIVVFDRAIDRRP